MSGGVEHGLLAVGPEVQYKSPRTACTQSDPELCNQ
jgi:hypothetical protein